MSRADGAPVRRTCLVAAAERHNLGDWLLAWCAQQLLGPDEDVAWVNVLDQLGVGMAPGCGPFLPLTRATREPWVGAPVLHPGGETLGCDLAGAAQMSLPPGSAISDQVAALGLERPLAYVTPERERVHGELVGWGPRAFFGVGARGVPSLEPAKRDFLTEALRTAAWVSVRDRTSAEALDQLGVQAAVHPDLATVLPSLLGTTQAPEETSGGILVQLSHGLMEPLAGSLISALTPMASGFPHLEVAIAGIAPGHDRITDLAELVVGFERAGAREWVRPAFELDPLAIARRIAGAGLVVASSLHYRILAMAFGVPAVTLGVPKAAEYAREWDVVAADALDPSQIRPAVQAALEPSAAERAAHAERLQALTLSSWREALEALHGR